MKNEIIIGRKSSSSWEVRLKISGTYLCTIQDDEHGIGIKGMNIFLIFDYQLQEIVNFISEIKRKRDIENADKHLIEAVGTWFDELTEGDDNFLESHPARKKLVAAYRKYESIQKGEY